MSEEVFERMNLKEFEEACFEIAFGDGAFYPNYQREEVLERLRQFSDDAFKWEEQEKGNE